MTRRAEMAVNRLASGMQERQKEKNRYALG
jgi:hypothetical protein